MTSTWLRFRAPWFLTMFALVAACEVTPEKIRTWRDSVNGEAKLRAALKDDQLASTLRVQALEALVELARFDEVTADLKSLDQADRDSLLQAVEKRLEQRLVGTDATKALAAKDAWFALMATPDNARGKKVALRLAEWILADWPARHGGMHSGQKILRQAGAPAARLLADKIAQSREMAIDLAPLLREIGDKQSRAAASKGLLGLLSKASTVDDELLQALGRLASREGREHLLKLAMSKGPADRRASALLALTLCADEAALPLMARLAADPRQPGEVRDRAFEVLEKTKSKGTIAVLSGLVAHRQEIIRYRAVEALTSCCEGAGVQALLAALPTNVSYKEADLVDYIEKDVTALGAAALPALRAALSAQSWIARLVAVRSLATIGERDDLPRLQAMVGDTTSLRGFSTNLGQEAKKASAKLHKRLGA